MRIAVIGAGIAGVSTAFELAFDGHQVQVFERCGSVAAEASFATAGLLAPGWGAALAPRLGAQALRPWQRHASVHLRGAGVPLTGLWRSWRARHIQPGQQTQLHAVAALGLARQAELRHAMQLDYERGEGLTVLLRTAQDTAAVQAGIDLLAEWGVPHKLLDPVQARTIERGLNTELAFDAALHLPGDEAGNCRQYAHLLRIEAQKLGAQFRFHTTVREIEAGAKPSLVREYTPPHDSSDAHSRLNDSGDTRPMQEGAQRESYDAIVVCAAGGSSALLRLLGIKLRLLNIGNYSLTAPLRQLEAYPDLGPRSALLDARHQVAVTRLGQRVRVAGINELGGRVDDLSPRALATLHKVLHELFPGAALPAGVVNWRGSRALRPDGRPVLGNSGQSGIWLSLAHGENGWPIAGGAARAIADQIGGRTPAASLDEFGL